MAETPTAEAPAEPMYPVVEAFVEKATPGDIDALFSSVREGLKELKGPRAAHAKKVESALAAAEELLRHLLQVREKLELDRRIGASGKK